MTERMIIYLHHEDLEHPSWSVLDANQTVTQMASHDSPDGLAAIGEGKEIIGVVPGQDVSFFTIELPNMSERRLLQAVPFALEDQIIEDLDLLHFAIRKADDKVHVAVITKSKMNEWISLLQSWQIKPDRLLPETLMLPFSETLWHVRIDDTHCVVKHEFYNGFVSEYENINQMLKLAIVGSKRAPEKLHLHYFTEHEIPVELGIIADEERNNSSQLMIDIAKNLNTENINLLQNTYVHKKYVFPQLNKLHKAIAYLSVALGILIFLYPIGSYFLLHKKLTAIQSEIKHIYTINFPNSSAMIAPKLRLQEKLTRLATGDSEQKALMLIGYVAKHLPNKIQLKKLDYQNNQLILLINAASSADISIFTNALQNDGLKVRQQNANINDHRIDASIVIE